MRTADSGVVAIALLTSACAPDTGADAVLQPADDRPSFVLMMGDDHGWEETGYNGHSMVQTPVLDAMAAEGLRLDRFYAAHPSCSPTRGSFLTGRHPNRYGTFAPELVHTPGGNHGRPCVGRSRIRDGTFRQMARWAGEGGVADQSGRDGV